MSIVRLTAFFKDDDGHGWSETHDKDGGEPPINLTSILSAFDLLMQEKRRPLLAGDAFYIGSRASYKTTDNQIAGDNIELDPPMRGPQTYLGTPLGMTAAEVAVKARFRNSTSTARSDVYIRGVWSQLVSSGVLDVTTTDTTREWKRRVDQYALALVNGAYGWQGTNRNLTSRGIVTGYQRNVDGTVTVNCTPANMVAIPAAGTRLSVKFARINRSKSIMNRVFACVVGVGAASFTTTEIVNPDDWVVGGTYIATITGFIPYAAMSYLKLAQRKTGRPFGVGPGRLRAAVLH